MASSYDKPSRKMSVNNVVVADTNLPLCGQIRVKCSRTWFYVPLLNLFLEYFGLDEPPTPDDLMVSLEICGFVAALSVAMLTAASQSYAYEDFQEAIRRISLNSTTGEWIEGGGLVSIGNDPFQYWISCTTSSINAFNAVLTITCLTVFHQSSISFQGPDDKYSLDLRRAW